MTNPLRRALDRLPFDDSIESMLVQGSLMAAEEKFFSPRLSRLAVDIEGPPVDAYTSSRVSLAVMETTAHFLRAIGSTDPEKEMRISRRNRESLGFVNLGSVGNTIYLGLPQSGGDETDSLISRNDMPTLTESSVKSLAEVLPEDDQDDAALDAALGLHTVQRVGLKSLSETLTDLSRSIELTLRINAGEEVRGQLSTEQAQVLKSSLEETDLKKWDMTIEGHLDGMRTRRRKFFLDTPSSTISGAVEESLLPILPQFIGKQVRAKVVVQQPRKKSGQHGRKAYRLIAIEPAS